MHIMVGNGGVWYICIDLYISLSTFYHKTFGQIDLDDTRAENTIWLKLVYLYFNFLTCHLLAVADGRVTDMYYCPLPCNQRPLSHRWNDIQPRAGTQTSYDYFQQDLSFSAWKKVFFTFFIFHSMC